MREEVEKGEQDREGLLHPQKAVEWPFAMELNNGFRRGDTLIRNDVLTSIITF